MHTYLAVHPASSKSGIKNDLRTITFEDWILMIIRANIHNLPEQMKKYYEKKR